MTYMDLVVPVILLSGAIGGLVNKFLLDPAEERALSGWQHVIVGIAAAFTVPVFLNMISSTLVQNVRGTLSDSAGLNSLLVLAGFCLLAAISSRAFIRSLSDRILKEHMVKELSETKATAAAAKATAEHAEAIAELSIEPEQPSALALEAFNTAATNLALAPEEQRILHAMASSRYTLRTADGLATDTQLTRAAVDDVARQLLAKGMLVGTKGKQGQALWYATALGRLTLNKHR